MNLKRIAMLEHSGPNVKRPGRRAAAVRPTGACASTRPTRRNAAVRRNGSVRGVAFEAGLAGTGQVPAQSALLRLRSTQIDRLEAALLAEGTPSMRQWSRVG